MLSKFTILLSIILAFTIGFLAYASSKTPSPIEGVMQPYLKIHDALAKDSLDGVSQAATDLGKAADDKMFPSELKPEAQALAAAKDLASAREAFKSLSTTLIKVVDDNNVTEYKKAYCPMEKAYWLQTGSTVSNPFGASMATCGSIVGDENSSGCPMGGGCCH